MERKELSRSCYQGMAGCDRVQERRHETRERKKKEGRKEGRKKGRKEGSALWLA